MALLQDEDFSTWYMRTSYLANIKDGVGERLININSSILNTPGFRAAGWTARPADIQRTYSPPIPTTSHSDYFQGPIAPGIHRIISWPEEEEDEGGVVTGRRSNDTIGPALATKRRRRREQMEEEDSSDLSDDSEDDVDGAQRAAQQIKFSRMPVRNRADSSPLRTSDRKEGPEVLVISPSRRSTDGRLRRGSLGAVEAMKARARRDTTTSSEMSSENEGFNPTAFARRRINSRSNSTGNLMTETLDEDVDAEAGSGAEAQNDNSDGESVESTISSEFGATLHSASLLDTVAVPVLDDNSSPLLSTLTLPGSSPSKKAKPAPIPIIQDFPPPRPRPISIVPPISLLGSAIRARNKKPVNPIEVFATLSGKGSTNPLWIKIYTPFSDHPETPYEMPLERTSKGGADTTVAEAIGLSLWRYTEQHLTPAVENERLNVNKWTLRMVEDGEVDFDFPALSRTKPMTDFTSNNNRGARGRSRERPYDEFALVEATPQQFEENQKLTPKYTASTPTNEDGPDLAEAGTTIPQQTAPRIPPPTQRFKPVLGQPFASAPHNTSLRPADVPEPQAPYATPRMGVIKTLRIRHLDLDVSNQATTMEITTDSYIAEILDHVCKLWNLDKAAFILKVSNTTTIAPLDRTIEALGPRTDLDLVRRRFGAGPLSLTGSPGSASPNAPLLIDIDGGGPKKPSGIGGAASSSLALGGIGTSSTSSKKPTNLSTTHYYHHPLLLAQNQQDLISSATTANFKRYHVTRKHLTAFAQGSHRRILALDDDYMHIMPLDTTTMTTDRLTMMSSNYYGASGGSGTKTTSIPVADITNTKVSSRHPKVFRVIIRRASESKRYDFEAKDSVEAAEIVDEIKKVMVPL